jgi:hypothetical protein
MHAVNLRVIRLRKSLVKTRASIIKAYFNLI